MLPNPTLDKLQTQRLHGMIKSLGEQHETPDINNLNLKQWLPGNGRFLLRQLEGAKAEMTLAVSACNLKRAISVLGARQLMARMG